MNMMYLYCSRLLIQNRSKSNELSCPYFAGGYLLSYCRSARKKDSSAIDVPVATSNTTAQSWYIIVLPVVAVLWFARLDVSNIGCFLVIILYRDILCVALFIAPVLLN